MKHIWHTVKGAIVVVLAAIPAILVDPSVAHYVAEHPWLATYLPIAAGVIHAITKAAAGGTPAVTAKPA